MLQTEKEALIGDAVLCLSFGVYRYEGMSLLFVDWFDLADLDGLAIVQILLIIGGILVFVILGIFITCVWFKKIVLINRATLPRHPHQEMTAAQSEPQHQTMAPPMPPYPSQPPVYNQPLVQPQPMGMPQPPAHNMAQPQPMGMPQPPTHNMGQQQPMSMPQPPTHNMGQPQPMGMPSNNPPGTYMPQQYYPKTM